MLLKQHLLNFLGVLIFLQYCGDVTGDVEEKARAPLSTMMKHRGNKHRVVDQRKRPGGGRPCKKVIKKKEGTANKSEDANQGRFFPGPFGWDINKFPIHLRPKEEPCSDEPIVAHPLPLPPRQPSGSEKDIHERWEEARCKALLESVKKNKPDRPKPGQIKYPEHYGWDVGLVIQTKEDSPKRRMREHNIKYEIHRCKKTQNRHKKGKGMRHWTAPDYAKIAKEMTKSKGEGEGGEGGGEGSGKSAQGFEFAPEGNGGTSDLRPEGSFSSSESIKAIGPYFIPSSLPAESFSEGGTGHAGIAPGLGTPPLRFLPWPEIFGYKPVKQGKGKYGYKPRSSKLIPWSADG